jgi:hypothetical protein
MEFLVKLTIPPRLRSRSPFPKILRSNVNAAEYEQERQKLYLQVNQ